MTIRILGGKLKGLNLQVPPESITRPMSVLLRRRLFDRYQDLSGVIFVDLCAGSGACSLEAFSRGAKEVYLNDPSTVVQKIISQNINSAEKRLGFNASTIIPSQTDAQKFLSTFRPYYETLDQVSQTECLILVAPPYPLHELYAQILNLISPNWFKGLLILESDHTKGPAPSLLSQWVPEVIKEYAQGSSYLWVIDYD